MDMTEQPIPRAGQDALDPDTRWQVSEVLSRFAHMVDNGEWTLLRLLYRDHPDYGGEVDHAALIERLAVYDGWALSTSAEALPAVLAVCPAGVRVAAWHRGERPTRSRWPLHAWEPVLYCGGRQLVTGARRADSLVCGVGPLDALPGRVIGAKPAAVCRWIFTLLGAALGDTLDDLFPGSGAVGRAWAAYTGGDPSLPATADASCQDPGDASSPAAGNGFDPSSSPAAHGFTVPFQRVCGGTSGRRPGARWQAAASSI